MTGPLFPENYSKIWIRGRFITMAGVAVRGKLTLAPTVTGGGLVNRSLKLIMSSASFSADTDNDGYVALQVPATNDPDITPVNFTYSVTTPIGQKFSIVVPYDTTPLNSVGDPLHGQPVIELIDMVPVGSSGGVGQLLRGIGVQSMVDNGAGSLLITYTDGATSTVAMPDTVQGPVGPAGPTGPASTVAGPQGPAGTGVLVDGSPVDALNVVSTAVGLADLAGFNTASAAQVATIAGLTHADDTILQTKAGAWAARTPAQLKTDLVLVKGDVGLGNVDNTSDANKPLSTAALAALASPPPAPGQYWYTASPHNSGTSATLGVGTLRVVAFLVRSPMALTRLAADVATAGEAGSKFRIGIYADDGFGRPGTLLVDAGQVAGDSATVQELTINVTLQPGVYWVGGAVQAVTTTQPAIRTVTSWQPPLPISAGSALPAAAQNGVGYSASGVTGAFPATFAVAGPASSAARIIAKAA